jgi:hypothetical protein
MLGAGRHQCVVAQRPDFAGVERDRVAAKAPVGDAVEADPVAAEEQADHLRAAVGCAVDDLAAAGVEHIQVRERVAAAIDRIAGMHHAVLHQHACGHQRQHVGDALAFLARFLGFDRAVLAVQGGGHGGSLGWVLPVCERARCASRRARDAG